LERGRAGIQLLLELVADVDDGLVANIEFLSEAAIWLA
jgi:hypothetical protein